MTSKVIILGIILLTLAGCSKGKQVLNEKDMINDIAGDDKELIQRINDIKQGLTPKIKPNKSSASSNDAETSNSAQQVQLKDLASQYDSAIIKTNFGDIKVGFYAQESPITVNNFLNLSKAGFYNGTKFHRVMKDFMIQGGDPNSKDDDWSNDGMGGPGYKFQDEINRHELVKGSLAMANSGPNTNGSQFFIVTTESTPWLDGKHTNFGHVVDGFDVVDRIEAMDVNENDHPINDAIIQEIQLIASEAALQNTGQAASETSIDPEVPSRDADARVVAEDIAEQEFKESYSDINKNE